MSFIKGVFAACLIGISVLSVMGIALILDSGVARAEIAAGSAYFLGDPGDVLENDGFDGDPTDGFGIPLDNIWGDPTGGLGFSGDPEGGLDESRIFGDPGDGMDNQLYPNCGDPGDGLGLPSGDPDDGLDYLKYFRWVWIP